jgi:hypothetical protein
MLARSAPLLLVRSDPGDEVDGFEHHLVMLSAPTRARALLGRSRVAACEVQCRLEVTEDAERSGDETGRAMAVDEPRFDATAVLRPAGKLGDDALARP